MTQTWLVEAPSPGHSVPASAVAALLEAPQDAAPAARMLDFLNQVAPVEYLSLVEYVDAAQDCSVDDAPRLVEAHTRHPVGRDVTGECFAIYRRRYWRSDECTRIAAQVRARPAATGPVAALRYRCSDIPLPSWRNEIYEREQLADRLTFVYAPRPRTAFAINLYRDASQGRFRSREIESLLAVCPLLAQVHRGALQLRALLDFEPNRALAPVPRAFLAIKSRAPELSPREAEVCARIACGVSADGIAAELDVAPSTVVTLRKRAYAKLAARGIVGGRMQLARLVGS